MDFAGLSEDESEYFRAKALKESKEQQVGWEKVFDGEEKIKAVDSKIHLHTAYAVKVSTAR